MNPGDQSAAQFDREAVRQKAATLAERGVYLGTLSWKYPGWRGMLYDVDPEGLAAGPERKTFLYVNNRLEGNALATIDAMMELAGER